MWNPKIIDTDKVLYVAIADAIERDIHLGILKPNAVRISLGWVKDDEQLIKGHKINSTDCAIGFVL